MNVGILGAGKVGIVLAQLAVAAGHTVFLANSRPPESLRLTAAVLVPGAGVVSAQEAATQADIIILALPFGKYAALPKDALKGKLVIDAMNYWWEVDGARDDILPDDVSSSEFIQTYLRDARVIKALSHIGYHDLHDYHRPAGAPDRKAIAIAGDDAAGVAVVSKLVDSLGFDPLYIGVLAKGKVLEPGGAGFGVNVGVDELQGYAKGYRRIAR